jgi:hypothetical protein
MEKTYHILSVYSYKGGELSTQLNLSYAELLENLVDTLRIYNYVYDQDFESDEERELNEVQVLRDSLLTGDLDSWIDDKMSIYAGGDGICFELYECENNIMTEMIISDQILAEVVECYIKNL